MNYLENPCKGCTERKLNCHSKCERYAKWRAEYSKDKKLREAETKSAEYGYRRERALAGLAKRVKAKQRGRYHNKSGGGDRT